MSKYVIISDSACDLEKSIRDKYDVKTVSMRYIYNCEDYEADMDWKKISAPDFYNIIRGGTRITTSQVPRVDYVETFSKYIEEGFDVLYIGCSSALSASIESACVVKDELSKKYPQAKIICVDALRACFALGILVITAAQNRDAGMSIEENAKWIEEHKNFVNMEGTVESLVYLKRAGRVSAISAFFGQMLAIKPIIIADAKGMNFAIEKVRGRQNSFKRLVERVVERYEDLPYQKVFISHADCYDDAITLKQMLLKALGKDIEITIGYVGSCIGATVGPGMIGIYFFGKEVTVNKD